MRRRTKRGEYLLCDARREVHRSTGGNVEDRRTYTDVYGFTALIFLGEGGVRFPPFSAGRGGAGGTLSRLTRRDALTVPDDPEFARRAALRTQSPDAVRPLLTPAVRAALTEHAGLTVWGENDTLVVVRERPAGGDRPAGASRPPRLRATRLRATRLRATRLRATRLRATGIRATGWCGAGRSRRRTARRSPPPPPRSSAPCERPRPEPARPVRSWRTRRTSAHSPAPPATAPFPRRELDRFLREPPPRSVPRAIRRATADRFAAWGRVIAWPLLLAGGAILWVVWGTPDVATGPRVVVTAGVALFLLTPAALILLTTLRNARRIRRALRHGRITTARIAAVERTGDSVTSGETTYRKYLVALQYEALGDRRENVVPLYGRHAAPGAAAVTGGRADPRAGGPVRPGSTLLD